MERFDFLVLPGDFGNVGLIRMLGLWLREHGVTGLGVYGNHEERYVLRGLKYGSFSVLTFGKIVKVHDTYVLGIPGVRGTRKWYHWSDQEVLSLADPDVDIGWIIAHEMPYGLADICGRGFRCGQRSLRILLEKLRPRLYIGGHLHGPPQVALYGGSLIVKSGTLSNKFSEDLWLSYIDIQSLKTHHYQCNQVKDSCVEYSVEVERVG